VYKRQRGLGDVYKRQVLCVGQWAFFVNDIPQTEIFLWGHSMEHSSWSPSKSNRLSAKGLARIWAAIAGFRVQSADRYTTRPVILHVFALFGLSNCEFVLVLVVCKFPFDQVCAALLPHQLQGQQQFGKITLHPSSKAGGCLDIGLLHASQQKVPGKTRWETSMALRPPMFQVDVLPSRSQVTEQNKPEQKNEHGGV
jgi:hypothetical protein